MGKYITFFMTLLFCFTIALNAQTQFIFQDYAPAVIQNDLIHVSDKPGILVIIKDIDRQQIRPFFFELHPKQYFYTLNFGARKYQVLYAALQTNWGTIENFCRIKRGIVTSRSLRIHLKGILSGSLYQIQCQSYYEKVLL